jgi:proteic killer suppression protein
MIRSIADAETEQIWRARKSRKLPPDIQQLNRTLQLQDLRVPAGNRLEQLKGFTPSRYSLRINDQWRITFRWSDGGADDVRIEDYHR